MALPLLNTFTGASSGTTITAGNSGGTGNNAFDVVSIGTGAALQFSNTHIINGSGALQVSTGSTSTSSYAEWTTTSLGAQTGTVYFRAYVYFTALPPGAFQWLAFFTNTGAVCAQIWINASGQPYAHTGAGVGSGIGFTNAVTLNAWNRIEGWVQPSTTVGQISISLYNVPNSYIPTETQTSAATLVLGVNIGQALWGIAANVTNIGPFWMDDVALGLSPIGPACCPVEALSGPIRAQIPPRPSRNTMGRVISGSIGPYDQLGPPIYPLDGPIRAQPKFPVLHGRVFMQRGLFEQSGPAVYPLPGPVSGQIVRRGPPPYLHGRTISRVGPYEQLGPPVIPLRHPVKAQPQYPVLHGRAISRVGVRDQLGPAGLPARGSGTDPHPRHVLQGPRGR